MPTTVSNTSGQQPAISTEQNPINNVASSDVEITEKQQNTLLLGNGPLDTIYEKYTDHSIKSTSESKLSTPSATNQSRIQEESKLGPRPTSIPPRCPPTRGPPRRGPPGRGPPGRPSGTAPPSIAAHHQKTPPFPGHPLGVPRKRARRRAKTEH